MESPEHQLQQEKQERQWQWQGCRGEAEAEIPEECRNAESVWERKRAAAVVCAPLATLHSTGSRQERAINQATAAPGESSRCLCLLQQRMQFQFLVSSSSWTPVHQVSQSVTSYHIVSIQFIKGISQSVSQSPMGNEERERKKRKKRTCSAFLPFHQSPHPEIFRRAVT